MDDDTPPLTLAGYAVHHLLGSGATGQVWLGREERTGDLVALKRLHDPGDAAGRHRLLREAALLGGFQHEHVIRLRGVAADADGTPVLVLDHAAGGSLASLLTRRGRLDPGEVVTVAAPLAQALASAHASGLVHADVTPANVLFDESGRPLLADLGVGRLLGERPGVVESTADYLDPAVAAGGQPTPATDVHALAAVCHHMLAGAAPYTGASLVQVLRAAAAGERTPLRALAPSAPAALLDVVERGLAADPAARPTAEEVAAGLLAAVPARPVRLRAGEPGVGPGPEVAHETGTESPDGPRWRGRWSGAVHRSSPADGSPAPGWSRDPDASTASPRDVLGTGRGLSAAGRPTHAVPLRLAAAAEPVEADDEDRDGWTSRVRAAASGHGLLVAAVVLVVLVAGAAVVLRGVPAAEAPAAQAPAVGGPLAVAAPARDVARQAAPDPESDEPVGDLGRDRQDEPDPATGARAGSAGGATAGDRVAAGGGTAEDWHAVVEDLDAVRAEAFARADPDVLDLVYVEGSEALAADRAVVDALTSGGMTIRGARHEVREVDVLAEAPGRARLRVVDLLPEHQVLDEAGTVVEEREATTAGSVELELVDAAGRWRIASVSRG